MLEAQLIAVVLGLVFRFFAGFEPWPAYLLGGGLGVAFYVRREKRDCETGLKLPSGSPKAWLLMWVRWKNLLDLVGSMLVHAIAWGIYLSQ